MKKSGPTAAAAAAARKTSLEAIKARAKKAMRKGFSDAGLEEVVDPFQKSIDAKAVTKGETGVVYDDDMLLHENPWDGDHIECPERLRRVRERCDELGLLTMCKELPSRAAGDEEILRAHSGEHLQMVKALVTERTAEEAKAALLPKSVYVNEHSLQAARLAAGAAVDLTSAVVRSEVQNGFALVRPPGHHASRDSVNGFCLFNNVVIAARHALDKLGVRRILIVDFDVHHGQGVQRAFFDDPRVLYSSIHRHEHGRFCPHLRESDFDFIGDGDGLGRNVNVALNEAGLGDSDYLSIFHQLLLPAAYEFKPELVLVCAGFDAAFGDPEGEMRVSPIAYGHMVSSLMSLAGGKVAVLLEGGYFIESMAESAAMTLRALLGLEAVRLGRLPGPSPSSVDSLLNTISALRPHWNYLQIQDEYSITEYDGTVDKNCHVPLVSYEGQPFLDARNPDKREFDPAVFYSKHPGEAIAKFSEDFRSMRARYADHLRKEPGRVALVTDSNMGKHRNMEEPGHPERPERILDMMKKLEEYGIPERALRIESRAAAREEILLVHDAEYFDSVSLWPSLSQKELDAVAEGFDSIYLNPSSLESALLSCGSLLNVVDAVCDDDSAANCGAAVIRPPGHHAEEDEACGFCIFNNVAVAAKYAIEMQGMERVMILDWDVHHGNGIQNMFYDDPRILYMSVHRFDNGTFFPCREEANYDHVGEGRKADPNPILC